MSSRSLENTIREIMRGPITEQVVVEGHFKVGDEVIYKGQQGEIVKLDTPQTGKYYHVEMEDGKVIKASSDELKLEDEDEEEDEDEDEDEDEKNESVNEKTLTPAEKKKREEIAKAIERDQPGMPMAKKMAIATATAKKVAEDADLNELSRSTLSRYKDKASDARLHKNLPTSKLDKRYSGVAKAVKRLDAKEEAELDEAVTVKKQNYSWGKMMTVHHGNETSYPLHPEHQAKIKALGDNEKTSFKDETKRTVIAHRDGDIIHLSGAGTSKKTAVKRSHFTEAVDKGEYDFEGDMAKTQLNTMMDAAKELRGMLKDDENMPEWVQSKITKAADYLDSARDYMKNRNMKPTDEQNHGGAERKDKEFVVKFENPSGGGVKLRAYMAKSDLDAESKAKVDARRMGMRVASVRLKEEMELEESVGSVVGGGMGQFIGNKIDPLHGEILRTHGAAAGRAAEYTIRKHLNNLHQALKKHLGSGKSTNEEAELDEATPTKQQVRQAIGIARDKRYAKGNVTGAVKAMDKVNPGLAQHPAVKKELQRQNEAKDNVPFVPTNTTAKTGNTGTVTDKSGAKHSPMSRTRHLARMAIQQMMKNKNMKETKSAPPGFHFTRDGRLKRGDADQDGPGGPKLRSDPLDKQRSKVPPVSD